MLNTWCDLNMLARHRKARERKNHKKKIAEWKIEKKYHLSFISTPLSPLRRVCCVRRALDVYCARCHSWTLYFECKIFSYGKIFICYIVEDHLETHEKSKSLIGEEKKATILNFRKFRCGAWWTESRWLTIDLWVEHAIGLRTRGDLISEKIRVFLVSGKTSLLTFPNSLTRAADWSLQ